MSTTATSSSSNSRQSPTEFFDKMWKEFSLKVAHIILSNRIVWPLEPNQAKKPKSSTWFSVNIEEVSSVNKRFDKILHNVSPATRNTSHYIYIDVFVETSNGTKKKNVLLERWVLCCGEENDFGSGDYMSPRQRSSSSNNNNYEHFENEYRAAYRKETVLMRSLYSYLLLLPAYKLFLRSQKNRRLSTNVSYHVEASIHASKSQVFEEGTYARANFSPITVPSVNSSIKLSVMYRLKSQALDELLFSQENHKAILTESQVIDNFFGGGETNVKPPIKVKRTQTGLDEGLRKARDRSNSMPIKRGNLHEAFKKKEEEERLHQKPPVYKPPVTDNDEQQHTQPQPPQPQQPQPQQQKEEKPVASKGIPIPTQANEAQQASSLPKSSSLSTKNSIPIKNKRQIPQQPDIDETPPFAFARQYSYGSLGSGAGSLGSEGRARGNSVGTAYSSSASPPFGNLLSSDMRKKNFTFSFSPLIDSPLGSYNPSSGMLSSSLKHHQHSEQATTTHSLLSDRQNSYENQLPPMLIEKHGGRQEIEDIQPDNDEEDKYDVHGWCYNPPSKHNNDDLDTFDVAYEESSGDTGPFAHLNNGLAFAMRTSGHSIDNTDQQPPNEDINIVMSSENPSDKEPSETLIYLLSLASKTTGSRRVANGLQSVQSIAQRKTDSAIFATKN